MGLGFEPSIGCVRPWGVPMPQWSCPGDLARAGQRLPLDMGAGAGCCCLLPASARGQRHLLLVLACVPAGGLLWELRFHAWRLGSFQSPGWRLGAKVSFSGPHTQRITSAAGGCGRGGARGVQEGGTCTPEKQRNDDKSGYLFWGWGIGQKNSPPNGVGDGRGWVRKARRQFKLPVKIQH